MRHPDIPTSQDHPHKYNNRRLHSQLDYVPPEEYEAAYYAHL
jgi:transposase InsO family protein